MAPRIAAAEPSVAGLVVLAGAAQPLHRAIVRQYRYLTALRDPGGELDDDPTIREITRQAALVDSLDLASSMSNQPPPLGVPFAYWLDLRGYDLVGWQTGLADRPDVTIRVLPADNHMFFSGSGQSEPAEYEPAQHVDDAVVGDVAQWIHRHADTTR